MTKRPTKTIVLLCLSLTLSSMVIGTSGSVASASAQQWTDNSTTIVSNCKVKSRQTVDGFLGLDWAETWNLNNTCTEVGAGVGSGYAPGAAFAAANSAGYNPYTQHYGRKNGVTRNCTMGQSNICVI